MEKRFERYRIASGLEEELHENQVNNIIYTMGKDTKDVITSLALTEVQQANYAVVMNQFENYFVIRRNVIFEHATLNQRY